MSRRALLRGAAGVTLALPWLEIMAAGTARAALPPKRLLTYFFANGMIPKDYECQGSEHDFTLSTSLAPLERHKANMIVTHGIGMSCKGFAHTDATPHVLTGMRHPPDAAEHGSFRAAMTTLDQELAKVVGAGTRYPSLEVGVHSGTDRLSTISWKSPTEMNVPRQDPYALAMEVFGVEPPGPAVDPERRRLLDKSVLDAVYESSKLLSARLGSQDRARLDAHLQSVHELENLLNTTDAPGGMAVELEKPSWVMGQKIDLDATDNIPLVFEMMMDLVAYALATDQTRVVTFMAGRSFGGFSLPWVDAAGDWHEFSHQAAAGDGNSTAKMTRIVTWLEGQLALLCDKLEAVQEPGGGSLLDNMTVCQMNEFGYDHQHRNLPYLFIGSGQGYFQTGRLLRFQQFSNGPDSEQAPFPGTWNNNVLVSLANMMGLEIDQFGDPAYPHGPVAGLRG